MKWKINAISDTHEAHKVLNRDLNKDHDSDSDILIHAGDISRRGNPMSVEKFIQWYDSLNNYKHKIFISGNHDICFENDLPHMRKVLSKYENVDYLQDEVIEVEKNGETIKIWGTPWTPEFKHWAFNLPRRSDIMQSKWDLIPTDVDILVTHTPPYSILDSNTDYEMCGDELLIAKIKEIKPKICIFGHIHEANGYYYEDGTHFINASVLDHRYTFRNHPFYFEWDSETNEIKIIK